MFFGSKYDASFNPDFVFNIFIYLLSFLFYLFYILYNQVININKL
jgi:hypothetical protein